MGQGLQVKMSIAVSVYVREQHNADHINVSPYTWASFLSI